MVKKMKKTFITFIGFVVLIIGIIMIPYPGPGWLVVFAALGILSTEYDWAKRLLKYAKQKYDDWVKWVAKQKPHIQLSISMVTLLVTIATLWLINCYGFINHGLHLNQNWLDSPLSIFH